MALYHAHHKVLSRSTRNTVAALAYRSGTALVNSQTGEVSDYTKKNVNHVEILLPTDAPVWAKDIVELVKEDKETGLQKLSDVVESAEKRLDAQIYREFEMALPRELSDAHNISLANEFVQDQLCGRGMLAIQNFHFDVDEKTGEKKPHCHTLLLTRRLTAEGLSPLKERAWNSKELHNDLREKWAGYVNFHLKMHGFGMRVDHRSYTERGIDLEAQPKMGKGALEVARKLGTRPIENGLAPEAAVPQVGPLVAWRRAAFLDVKVRNAYRLLANPKIVLDAVSSTQSVFGVKDLEKVIGRYTDDVALKDRLLAKVLSSSEVVVLSAGKEAVDPLGQVNISLKETSLREDRLLLTTASLLKAELSLVAQAKDLGQRAWQAEVSKTHTSGSLTREVETVMKAFEAREGFGLSEEQRQAVTHMVSGGQLSCIVGYAGAGKTTALKVAKEVFESSGYAVVGLAPTGRAAQNLQDSGISSQTLHRFLRSFEGGRNQLKANTVLVLDEAGMVDVKLFEGFLSAVEKLGVKAIVVGDGAQLQAVGAGDAFRLVTKALDPVVMADVRRQTLEWQREATKAFGRLETREALKAYVDKGHVTFMEEKVPALEKLVEAQDFKGIVELYTLSRRMEKRHLMTGHEVMNHNEKLSEWKEVKLACATHMAAHLDVFRPHMEAGGVDPLGFASHFVTRHDSEGKTRAEREFEAAEIAQRWKLPPLTRERFTGDSRATQIDGRTETKAAMVAAWKASLGAHPTSSHLMLAYANKDVADLNRLARAAMKEASVIRGPEFTYATLKVTRHGVTSHGDPQTVEKSFAVGDRLMFGKNDRGLDVKNGMMGTVEFLSASKIVVRLDGHDQHSQKESIVSFSPKLYPFFDHGFAVTTHKAQGVTVDRVFKLASFEEYGNLAYVGMTRHREDVRVFGSTLDFWNKEIFLNRLSAENNKLALMDMAPEHVLREKLEALPSSLTKTFERMGNHLEAMGFVAKHLYQKTIETFLQSKEVEPDLMDLPSFAITDAVKADVKEQETGRDIFHSPEALTLMKAGETAGIHDPKAFALRGLEEQKILSERGETFSSAHLQTLIQRVQHEEKRFDRLLDISRDELFGKKAVLSPLESLQAVTLAHRHCAIESRLLQNAIDKGSPMSESSVKMAGYKAIEESLSQEREMTKQFIAANHTPLQAAILASEIMRIKDIHDILLGTQTQEQRSQMLASLEPKQAALEREFQINSDALIKAQELQKAEAQKQNIIQGIPVSEETMGFVKMAKNANLKDPQSFAVRCLEEKNIFIKQGHELTAKHIQSLIQRVQHEEKRFDRLLDISRDELFGKKAVLSPLESLQAVALAHRHCAIESRLLQNAIDEGKERTDASIKMDGYKAIETSIAQEKDLTAQLIAENHSPSQAAILAAETMRIKDVHGLSLKGAYASPLTAAVQKVATSFTPEKENEIRGQAQGLGDKLAKDYAQYVLTITARECLKEASLNETSRKDGSLKEDGLTQTNLKETSLKDADINRVLHKSLSETASIEKFESLIQQQRQMEKQREQSRSMGMDR